MATRRVFLQFLGGCSVLGAMPAARAKIHYVGRNNVIHVCKQACVLQSVPSENPSFLARDTSGSFLFALNEIREFQGLPTGSVESYAVHPESGFLKFISRQALSLSATMPRSAAISPDGQHLVVAAYGGGAYNVLPIDAGGAIGQVTQVFKEIGGGSHCPDQTTAHPHSVVFHPSGRFVISTDMGADWVSVFSFEGGRIKRVSQVEAPPGSGPAQLVFDPDSSQVCVRHRFTGLHSMYSFDAHTGGLTSL